MQTEEQSRHISKNLRIHRAWLTVLRGDPPLLMTNRFHLGSLSPLLAAGSAIAHTSWAAEEVKLLTFHYLPHMLQEALPDSLVCHRLLLRVPDREQGDRCTHHLARPDKTASRVRTPRRSATDSK